MCEIMTASGPAKQAARFSSTEASAGQRPHKQGPSRMICKLRNHQRYMRRLGASFAWIDTLKRVPDT
jgi:hypothetical protein